MWWRVYAVFFVVGAAQAASAPGNSERGRQVFENQGCVQCHTLKGKGGTTGPDLGKLIDRNFTPALLAATMWNHAPAMWETIRKQGGAVPKLSDEATADLFAFFVSTRFFDRPGDAGRGKTAFASEHCADCHGITESKFAGAQPVSSWESLGHPIEIARAMWNHSGVMREALAKKGFAWPQLTGQELSDILVYLRNLPETRNKSAEFSYMPAAGGETVFAEKGCAKCHTGAQALESRLTNATLTDIAVAMWNHAPKMTGPPPELSADDMQKLVGEIWLRQWVRGTGDRDRGKRVFTAKKCVECHTESGIGPKLARAGGYSGISMITALWGHGPQMLSRMQERKVAWPRFEGGQMTDLIAYLNSLQ